MYFQGYFAFDFKHATDKGVRGFSSKHGDRSGLGEVERMSRNPCYINVYLCQEQAECGTTSNECNKAADSGFGSEVMSWFDKDVDISETHIASKASSERRQHT